MAKYKIATYGVTPYGELQANIVPYEAAMSVVQPTYNTAKLSWLTVSPDVGESDPSYYKLVRTTGGAPDSPYNGQVLIEGLFGSSPTTYEDTNTDFFPSGTQVTYSYWVLDENSVWRNCGSVEITVVHDDSDTTFKLLSLLPQTWVNAYGTIGDSTGVPDIPPNNLRPYDSGGEPDHRYDLWAFLNALSFYYDKLRYEISALRDASDYFSYPRKMLSTAVDQLMFDTEPSLGDTYHRTLYKSGNLINSLKGTKLGVQIFGSALTHSRVVATMGQNLMLDYNSSSFEESVGSWVAASNLSVSSRAYSAGVATIVTSANHGLTVGDKVTIAMNSDVTVTLEDSTETVSLYSGTYTVSAVNSTTSFSYTRGIGTVSYGSASATGTVTFYPASLSAKKYANSITDLNLTSLLIPPSPNFSSGVRVDGYGLITAVGNGTILMNSWNTTYPVTYGIPVTPGKYYHFCGYVKGPSATGTIRTRVVWFSRTGAVISRGSYGTTVSVSTSWQYFDASEVAADCLAPATAVYAGVEIEIASLSDGNQLYLDMFNFSEFPGRIGDLDYGIGENIYEDARTVHVMLDGARTNYFSNPLFEDSVMPWFTSSFGEINKSTDYSFIGSSSGKVTSSVGGSTVCSDWILSENGEYYTASVYIRGNPSNTGTTTAFIGLQFTSPYSAEDQVTLKSEGTGASLKRYYYDVVLDSPKHAVESTPITVSKSSWTRISVTAQAPEYAEGSQPPLMQAYVAITTNSGNSNYIDCALLEKSALLLPFFSGSGLYSTEVSSVISIDDCRWENRTTLNFISNPSFETNTSGWTSSGTTSFASITPGVGDPAAKYGAKIAKVVASGTNNYVQYVFSYPKRTTATFPVGGENVSVSVDVAGGAGTYTITFTDGGGLTATRSFIIPSGSTTTWTRIAVSGITTANAESATLRVTCSANTTWYLDGAQAEFGPAPTNYVGPSNATALTTRVVVSGTPSTVTMYGYKRDLVNIGRSYYWPNLDSKASRLNAGMENMLTAGSSFAIDFGEPRKALPDIAGSLISSSSFESGTYGWTVAAGSLSTNLLFEGPSMNNYGVVGAYYGVLTMSGSVTGTIRQGPFSIDENRFYDVSAAFQIPNSAYAGTAYVTIDWYDSASVLLTTYVMSLAISSANKWYYVGNKNGSYSISGSPVGLSPNLHIDPPTNAASARLTLSYDPTSGAVGNKSVYIDNVVFRPTLY